MLCCSLIYARTIHIHKTGIQTGENIPKIDGISHIDKDSLLLLLLLYERCMFICLASLWIASQPITDSCLGHLSRRILIESQNSSRRCVVHSPPLEIIIHIASLNYTLLSSHLLLLLLLLLLWLLCIRIVTLWPQKKTTTTTRRIITITTTTPAAIQHFLIKMDFICKRMRVIII